MNKTKGSEKMKISAEPPPLLIHETVDFYLKFIGKIAYNTGVNAEFATRRVSRYFVNYLSVANPVTPRPLAVNNNRIEYKSQKMETGEKTFDADIQGEKLYQKRARRALPILVRQAKAEQPIYYSDLAQELGMPNPRNLNYVLGAIGNSLRKLGKEWKEEIPLINVIVVNKNDNLPGEGIGYFIKDRDYFENSSKKEKRRLLNLYLSDVFNYSKWDDVLKALNLKPPELPIIKKIINNKTSWGKGESPEHERLKIYISKHPAIVGINKNLNNTITEYTFPSQDAIDILFKTKFSWIGVEVKSHISDIDDILRGLFQCVKYKALMEADQIINNTKPNVEVFLVVENEFPDDLLSIKNLLGINVIDNVKIE